MLLQTSGIEKIYGKEQGREGGREYQDFPSEFFCHQSRKNLWGEILVLLLFRVSKNVRYKRGGIKIFRQNFFVSVPKKFGAKKFRRGTILCFTKFLVSKIFMEKSGGVEDGGSITIFRQNFLVSVPKKFVGEPFSVSLSLGLEKSYA